MHLKLMRKLLCFEGQIGHQQNQEEAFPKNQRGYLLFPKHTATTAIDAIKAHEALISPFFFPEQDLNK